MAPTISPRDSTVDLDRHYQIINGLIVVTIVAAGLLAGLIYSWVRHAKKNADLQKLRGEVEKQNNTIFYFDRVVDEYITRHGVLPKSFLEAAEKYPAVHNMPQRLQLQSFAPPTNLPAPVQPAAQNTLTRNNNGVMRAQASTSIRNSVARGCETIRQKLTRPARPAANTERRTEAGSSNERADRVRQRDEEETFTIGRDSEDSERGAPRETIRSVPAASVRGESSSRAGSSSGRGPASASGSRQGSSSPRAPASASGQGSVSSRHARFTEGA